MHFVIGQRWASHAEVKLGLGIVTEVVGRRVSISFPAVGETRSYAIENAPLTRIRYNENDIISDMDDKEYIIQDIIEENDLLIYHCLDQQQQKCRLDELELSCFVQFTTPLQRLFSGHIDKNSAYELRIETLIHTDLLQQSSAKGLLGSRTNLLPHQIYISHEVAQRHAPRVLLADEVGLGKTIEAGMIVHHQLHTGKAARVLILVPESLVHQWLVEMLRRFNLHFSVFDSERIAPAAEDDDSTTQTNPFDEEQLILCNLNLLVTDANARAQALQSDWDLVVVDEAHHLEWNEDHSSEAYQCVESFAQQCKGLLLLTATPEQVGIEGHFARLRLLDAARFYDLNKFKQEQHEYRALNQLVQEILDSNNTITPALHKSLAPYLGENIPEDAQLIIQQLLDQHGTGRVFFRNTRAAIEGFPRRELSSYPLPLPELYADCQGITALTPEQHYDSEQWLKQDPRVAWLESQLKSLKPHKVLVVCHAAETAMALEEHLHLRVGIRSSAFHQHLSLLERDRAAAYFADEEDGAQVLICSEIGSEGRNFQFSHHLILFDLPLNPDLLEQRIGRLDRIGQRHNIQIHVPYLSDSAQATLFHWYQEGLNLFTQNCSAAYAIYQHFAERLHSYLEHTSIEPVTKATDFQQLLLDTREYTLATIEQLQSGRDRLLELNGCNQEQAQTLIEQIRAAENSEVLANYMEKVFDEHGVNHDYHSEQALILEPSDHMHGHFPGLGYDGLTITYNREKALSREDITFLSWEHPMVQQSMDLILGSELGNTAVSTISIPTLPAGTLLLEAFFTIDLIAPKHLQLERYLSLSPIRCLIDIKGNNLHKALNHKKLNSFCEPVNGKTARAIALQVRPHVESMVKHAQQFADKQLPDIRNNANNVMQESLHSELARLQALQKINPNIRDDEIEFIQQTIYANNDYIERANLQLQALRLIVNK